jgi:multidrug efflux pump subunit AcrB
MTLGGMALAIGILVDEATVPWKTSTRTSRMASHLPAPPSRARGDHLPRLLAMLCILAVFIPAFFMVGAAKALFVPLALAVGFSMIASFLLSSTLVPMLSVWLLKNQHVHEEKNRPRPHCMRLARTVVVTRAGLLFRSISAASALIIGLSARSRSEIFPQTDTGQFAIRFRAPSGTQVGITEKIAQKILKTIAAKSAGKEKVAIPSAWSACTTPASR